MMIHNRKTWTGYAVSLAPTSKSLVSFEAYVYHLNILLKRQRTWTILIDELLMVEFSWRSSNSSIFIGATCKQKKKKKHHFYFRESGCTGQTDPQNYLRVFASQMAVHGGTGRHLGPTEVTRLGFDLLMGQVNVLLQHILCQVLLIAVFTFPCLTNWSKE